MPLYIFLTLDMTISIYYMDRKIFIIIMQIKIMITVKTYSYRHIKNLFLSTILLPKKRLIFDSSSFMNKFQIGYTLTVGLNYLLFFVGRHSMRFIFSIRVKLYFCIGHKKVFQFNSRTLHTNIWPQGPMSRSFMVTHCR